MSKIIFSFSLVFFLIMSLHSQQVFAKGSRYYRVEVVLFKHLNEQGKNNEFWTQEVIAKDNNDLHDNTADSNQFTDDTLTWAEYNLQNRTFSALTNGIFELSANNYKLTGIAARLNQSDNYELLAHFGWNQARRSKTKSLPIQLVGNTFGENLLPSGTLKLYASRYFHFQVDLEASQCAYNNESSNAQECNHQVYVFKQNRKMKSYKLHYLDNPVFGMLIYVIPL